MNPYLTYIKLDAAAVLLAILFGAGYHFGGLASKTALEAAHTAQLQAVVKAMDDNARAAATEHATQQKVIDAYDRDKDIPDPASVGTAHRLLILAAAGGGCAVQQAGAVAGGAQGATPVPIGPSRVEQALDAYVRACSADAAQLTAVIQLAP